MRHVFISYRRMDTEADAGRLMDSLVRHLGAGTVFRDHDGIPPGVDFDTALTQELAQASVVLVLIGPKWLEELKRRATLPDRDFVRAEVASALTQVPRVVPVLLRGATLPRQNDLLPDLPDLAGLLTKNLFELRDGGGWDDDVRRLAVVIGLPYNWSRLAVRCALFLLVVVPGLYLALQDVSVETARQLLLGALAVYAGCEAAAARWLPRR